MADLDEENALINSAIAAKRNIEAPRRALEASLGGHHPNSWKRGVAASIAGYARQEHAIDQETNMRLRALHNYNQQRNWEANQRRLMAHGDVEEADKQIKLDRETAIDEQGAQLMMGLGRLDALHRSGQISSSDYDNALLDLGQQNLLGTRHPTAGKMYEHFLSEADRRNAFAQRRQISDATKIAQKYGIDVATDEDGNPSISATQRAARASPRGRAELMGNLNKEMSAKYGVNTGVGSLFNPISPHTSDDNNQTINLPFLNNKGEVASAKVAYPVFNQMKADFQDRYNFASGGGPPQSEPTAPAAPANSPLANGTIRNVGGKDYIWDGSKWSTQ